MSSTSALLGRANMLGMANGIIMEAPLWTEVLIPAARWQLVILGMLTVRLTGQQRAKIRFISTQPETHTHTQIYIYK